MGLVSGLGILYARVKGLGFRIEAVFKVSGFRGFGFRIKFFHSA